MRALTLAEDGKRLGKDILSDGANTVAAIAAKYRPDLSKKLNAEEVDRYIDLMKIACAMAADVAPYESPRLQSTTVNTEPTDLSRLTDAELEELDRIARKASVAPSDDRGGKASTRH